MKKVFRYLAVVFVVLITAGMVVSCNDNELFSEQETTIQRYLESSLRLEYYGGGEEPEGGFYTRHEGGAFRWIAGNTLIEGGDNTTLQMGDTFEYDFAYYAFGSSTPDNIPFYASWWEPQSPPNETAPSHWTLSPRTNTLGDFSDTNILKYAQLALPDCQRGDSVIIFLPSDLAYGDRPQGLVPAKTPLKCTFVLRNITKANE